MNWLPSWCAAFITMKLPAAGSMIMSPGLGGGTDQSGDQADRLDMWVKLAVDLLGPAVRDAVISPRRAGFDRRLHHLVAQCFGLRLCGRAF